MGQRHNNNNNNNNNNNKNNNSCLNVPEEFDGREKQWWKSLT